MLQYFSLNSSVKVYILKVIKGLIFVSTVLSEGQYLSVFFFCEEAMLKPVFEECSSPPVHIRVLKYCLFVLFFHFSEVQW